MTTTLEDRLRDAYQAAAQTVQPGTIRPDVRYQRVAPDRRRPQRRFTLFAPVAAAAAVVVAIGAAVAVPHLVTGSSHGTATQVTTPAMPPFMAEVAAAPGSKQLVIQQARTRRATAFIAPPDGASFWDAVAATSDNRYIAAATGFSGSQYTSILYQLTLSPDGKLRQLTRLSSGIRGEISGLTASKDGRRIAYMTVLGNSRVVSTIGVLTGHVTRQWTVPAMAGRGSTGLLEGSLSFNADGSELGLIMFRMAGTAGSVRAAGSMWLLPVNAAPGSATARSRKVTTGPRDSAPLSAVLSGDGQTMYVLSRPAPLPYSHSVPESLTLSAYSTVNGALLRTVHTWTDVSPYRLPTPGMTISGGNLLVWGVGGDASYQVDPASGATKPISVYFLHDKYIASLRASIAW